MRITHQSSRPRIAARLKLFAAAALLAFIARPLAAQDDFTGPTLIAPPPTATAPAPAPRPTTAPATAPSSIPSAESVLQNLLKPAPSAAATVTPETASTTALTPASEGPAPNQPTAERMREGDKIVGRVGRLSRDEKTGQYLFAFEADGKPMQDPPMGLVPCQYLEKMEKLTEDGKKAFKFKVTGEVTEYKGKNFLYIQILQVVPDLNKF